VRYLWRVRASGMERLCTPPCSVSCFFYRLTLWSHSTLRAPLIAIRNLYHVFVGAAAKEKANAFASRDVIEQLDHAVLGARSDKAASAGGLLYRGLKHLGVECHVARFSEQNAQCKKCLIAPIRTAPNRMEARTTARVRRLFNRHGPPPVIAIGFAPTAPPSAARSATPLRFRLQGRVPTTR
jgi:hypothetical protein